MGRSACRGRAAWWRAVCSMILAAGGLTACGPEPADVAVATDAAKAPPGGDCRRWTTCVPENPCHTGWVTGCRANVPICTDIGGWLSNGTTCGTDAVCYMGECEPCAAGASCPIPDMYGNPDACRVGAIACGSGQPVCEEQGPAPDGTACWGGGPYVCKAGQCTYCVEGSIGCIPPEGPCHEGRMTSCSTGGTCVATGNLIPNGAWCAQDGSVCRDGDCVACPYGPCQPEGMSCYDGYVSCPGGSPVCSPQGPKPDGTPCDGGGECRGGACIQPCVPDQPCAPSNVCYSGRTVCDPFYGTLCQERERLPDGTQCPGGVCASGSCSPCGPSSWCQSPTPCFGSGTISCATGQCEPSPPPYAGSTCGLGGESCSAEGLCVDDLDPRLVVRSASGTSVDLTGTTWSHCMTDGAPGESRRATDTYGAGTITHVEETFATPDCTGDPQSSWIVNGQATSAGDRLVSWAGGIPPPSAPWFWSVTATAVHVTGEDPVMGPLDFKFLIWVNDWVAPRQLFQAENDYGMAWDGYPTLLVPETNPLQEVLACDAGAPCSPGYPTCEVFAIDCSGGAPACLSTGTFLPDGARCGDGLWCQGTACVPVPTRTVTGSSRLTYWPDAGPIATMDPAPLSSIAALQFGSTGFVSRPGVIFPDGSFEIPGVEEGPYQLEIWRAGAPLEYVATTSSTIDLGLDVLGRQDVAFPTQPTSVFFDVKGLVPWSRGDVLEFASSNAGVAAMPFGGQEATTQPEGVTELAGPFDWTPRPLVDGPAGDVAYVVQGSTTTALTGERVTAATGWAELPPTWALTDVAGGTVDVTLGPCPTAGSLSADWRRAEFETYAAQVHPAATPFTHRIVVAARPHASPFAPGFRVGNLAQYPGVPLLVVQANAFTGDAVLGETGYGRFLPPLWREYRHDRLNFSVLFQAPGAARAVRLNAPLGYNVAADAAALGGYVVAPIVTPPLGLLIDGVDAWSGVSGVGTTPRISWTAPPLSPAAAVLFPGASLQYRVTVYEVRLAPDGLGTQLAILFVGNTTRTAYRLPGTFMVPGGTYVVEVRARLTAESIDAPLRASIEEAFATVVSREFTP